MRSIGLAGVMVGLIASSLVSAQTGTISGFVTALEGARPIGGAQVTVVGTPMRAVTRDNGRYTITAVNPGAYTVRAVRIGFAPDSVTGVSVTAGSTAIADLQLRASGVVLSDVVVVGYGTQQARDRTGSIETVTPKDFNTGRIISPEQLIQSKVAGVQVVDNNEPGGGIALRIRGGTSVTSSNEPLFVVDGVPLPVGGGLSAGRNPLNFLSPEDIASITVLKDASATAIYGSRGANGVIMVTTKTGAQQPQLSYSSTVSTSSVTRRPDVLDAAQFRAVVTQYAPARLPLLGRANTNWLTAVERSGAGRENTVAVAGRRDDMNYRLSVGYLDQEGVLRGTAVNRLTAALSYRDVLFDRLDIQTNVRGARAEDAFTPGGVLGSASAFAPTQPILAPSGAFFEWNDTLPPFRPDPLAPANPLSQLALVSLQGTTYRSVGNAQAKYRMPMLDALTTTINLGYDVTLAGRRNFFPSTERTQIVRTLGGTVSRTNDSQINTVLDIYANYARPLAPGGNEIDVTAGYSYEQSHGDYPSFFAQGLSSDLLGPFGVPTATLTQGSIADEESRLVSGFARVNATLRDRYVLTLSIRKDGSSRFGPNNQWGTFPSAAFAWRLAEEPFMKRFTALSDLKLRLSWGVNGNQSFANYQAYSTYLIGTGRAQAQFGNQFVPTIRPSAADPNIRWEQTTSTNVGVDYGVLNNRITGTIDYYYKRTKDLIFDVPVAAGTNLSNFLTTNIGSLENRGLELGLGARIFDGQQRGFTWDANLIASTNSNKLLRINAVGAGNEQILTGRIAGGVGTDIQVLQPGYAINSFFVYQHKRGPDGMPIYSANPLNMYVDINGDGIINQADRRAYKNPAPKWIFGHTSQMRYRNTDLSFTLRAYTGNYVYNNVASDRGYFSAVDRRSPVNLHASVLRFKFVDPQYFSDAYVEDAAFLRMDNLALGYTFRRPGAVGQIRVFGAMQNVFTITHYSGVDPTAGVNGIDNNIYPRARTVLAGASVAF
ncbi:MAG: TonB-dependent receptor [Gemmatimonadaceae bacterium]